MEKLTKVKRILVRFEDDKMLVVEGDSAEYYWNLLIETGKVVVDSPGGKKASPKFVQFK